MSIICQEKALYRIINISSTFDFEFKSDFIKQTESEGRL